MDFAAITGKFLFYTDKVFNTTQESLQEVFNYESWNSNFEWNLLVLICIALVLELVTVCLAWRKYSKKIFSYKQLSEEDSIDESR